MEENRISTKRLLLRPYEEADRDPVIRILRNKEISSTFMLPDFEDDAAADAMFRKLLILSHQENIIVKPLIIIMYIMRYVKMNLTLELC